MAYVLKEYFANPNNYGGQRQLSDIKFIVIHYTANDGDSDENNGNYFKNNIRNASSHYFVDSDSVTRSVADNYIAWSVGGGKYNDCAQTGGGKYYGVCTNENSISIELCDDYKDGNIKATQATIDNAIELTKFLMVKYSIPVSNVIRHFDVNGKHCPGYWCCSSQNDNLWLTEFHNKLSLTTTNETGVTPYRVRLSWGDARSQIGAYNDLNNAKNACKDGYTVFDNNGTVVYSKNTSTNISNATVENVSNTPVNTTTSSTKKEISPHTYYQVIAGGTHYAEVCDLNDYAGVNEKKNITDVAIKVDVGSIKYRVHVKGGGWLPEVTGYNWNDGNNGYAGNGREIDGFQAYYYTPSGCQSKRAKYRVSVKGQNGYLPFVYDYDDFAGIYGRTIDAIQICIE